MSSAFFRNSLFLAVFFLVSNCAPSVIHVNISDKSANEVIMNVSKVKANKKWPAFTLFVLEDALEENYSIISDVEYKRIGGCAFDASCYQFIVPWNNHGIDRKVQEFDVHIVNMHSTNPFASNTQTIEFYGNSKKNRKGYDLMLGDDIGEPVPYAYSRGSFFLEKINPYPKKISFSFEFIDPALKRAIQGAEISLKVPGSKSENQQQIKQTHPNISCFDEQVWLDFNKTELTDQNGMVVFGNSEENIQGSIYPDYDGKYELEIIAQKSGLVPIKAKILGKMKGDNTLEYTIYWPSKPDQRNIVDGYLFPDIMQK